MISICSTLDNKLEVVHRNNLFEKFDTQVSSQIYNKLLVKYKYELLFFNNQLHDQMRNNLPK